MKGLDEDLLRKIQNTPDEFQTILLNVMYNHEADQCYCLIDAPTMDAVQKHHDKFGIGVIG